MFEVPAQVQLQKLKDGRAIATFATVPRPFCCQSFLKMGCTMPKDEYFSMVYNDVFLA